MPRFFFQLTDGLKKVADSGGQIFANATEARQHATACTEAFSRRAAQFNGNEGLYWSVQVIDETGSQVFTLQLAPSARPASKPASKPN
ncbi:MAG: hypothetical protein Q7T81_04790 [Pseudolabrys sp.]|nr:hypothetical protein [Pseudolabrys sp.]